MALNKEITSIARSKVGQYLIDIRKFKKLSRNQMVRNTGLTYQQIQAIEEGTGNYSIDAFLTYISALDCYFYLANKDGGDLIEQSDNPT